MNISNLIKAKRDALEKERSEVIKKHDLIDILSVVGLCAGLGAAAAFILFINPIMAIPCLGFAGGMLSLKHANKLKRSFKEQRINQELNHFKNLNGKPFNASDETNKKRKKKRASLKNILNDTKSGIQTCAGLDGILTLGLAGATAVALCLGGAVCLAPVVVAGLKAINDVVSINRVEEGEYLQNRIDNLSNDLDIANHIRTSQPVVTTPLPAPQPANTVSNTRTNSRAAAMAVDAVIEDMADRPAPEKRGFQKVKR